jgi:Ca2+/H+ antiporter
MAAASEPDNTPLPGTVFTPRQVRALKIAVIVMGILLVGGFAVVVAGIMYQASQLGDKKAQTPAPAAAVLPGAQMELVIPSGATVTAMALDGDRLALHLKSSTGPEVLVIDVPTGKVISRIRLKAQ